MRKSGFALLVLLLALSHAIAQPQAETSPKNIILFIGDGMGVAQVTAGKTAKGTLNLEQFPVGGLMTTHSSDSYVTDSAAGATALATGVKTYNGAIGVDPNKKPLKTVLEYAEDAGKSTGLVATCTITHATPASFAAHVEGRSLEPLIAEDLAKSNVDVMFGGGWSFFVPNSQPESKRTDNKDLLAQLSRRMKVIRTPQEFAALSGNDVTSVAGLFAAGHLSKAKAREVSLLDMTRKAIQILSKNSTGFFLMVEGSQIDWAGHDNDSDGIINEMVDLDEAVGAGLSYAKENGQTLVVVTADHETGGYALNGGSLAEYKITMPAFTTKNHTGVMVPVFAYGPGSVAFGGIHDNTLIGSKLIEYVQNSGGANSR